MKKSLSWKVSFRFKVFRSLSINQNDHHFSLLFFRDFAYVAKDKTRSDNTYKCHVFRCENVSARVIGEILKEISRNLMAERGLLNSTHERSNNVSSILENTLEISAPTGFLFQSNNFVENFSFFQFHFHQLMKKHKKTWIVTIWVGFLLTKPVEWMFYDQQSRHYRCRSSKIVGFLCQ